MLMTEPLTTGGAQRRLTASSVWPARQWHGIGTSQRARPLLRGENSVSTSGHWVTDGARRPGKAAGFMLSGNLG
jgi:hypothetical protein